MASARPNLHAVDELLNWGVGEGQEVPAAERPGGRGARRKANVGSGEHLEIPELKDAYRVITEAKAVGGKARSVYFTSEELERLERAAYHLGGIPLGHLGHFGVMFLIQALEEKNGGRFPAIPNR